MSYHFAPILETFDRHIIFFLEYIVLLLGVVLTTSVQAGVFLQAPRSPPPHPSPGVDRANTTRKTAIKPGGLEEEKNSSNFFLLPVYPGRITYTFNGFFSASIAKFEVRQVNTKIHVDLIIPYIYAQRMELLKN